MTKKDYKKIAEVFRWGHGYSNAEMLWQYLQSSIAAIMAEDNPKFNREKFNRACEGGDGKE